MFVSLRTFRREELLYDASETKAILEFFFPVYASQIRDMAVSDKTREFAQGLLVEAVDASLRMGFIEALFRSTANPRSGGMSILRKLGTAVAKQWFKNGAASDLRDLRIYESIRKRLSLNFQRILVLHLSGIARLPSPAVVHVASAPAPTSDVAWT